MSKKTIITLVVALILIGGLYYYGNNWLAGRSITQAVSEIFKGKTEPGTGIVTGGEGDVKNPEALFNETEEVVLSSKTLPMFTENVKPELEKVFGKVKVTSYGKYSDYEGSFKAVVTVPKIIAPQDLTKIEEFYAQDGYETSTNEVSSNSGTLEMEKEGTSLEFSYFGDDQNISIWYIPLQSEE